MQARKEMARFTRFPAISQAAEYQVMGYLVRRNILTYKAPPTNEGYDLICIHPDPRKASRQILTRGRCQVRQVVPRSTRSHSVRAGGPAILSGGQPLPIVRRPLLLLTGC